MKRFWFGSIVAVAFSLSMNVGEVRAQPVPGLGPAGTAPAFSPYLNMVRNSGSSPAINYFGIVRPQIQTNQALLGLTADQTQNRQAIGDLANGGVSVTGHTTQFLNYGGYFLNKGTGTGGTSSFGGSPPISGGLGSTGGGMGGGGRVGMPAVGGGGIQR